jgi:branched-chain amino acid transport system ATP-binding protein
MLVVDKLRVSIGGVSILRDTTLPIEAGKTTILIGRNGAGKTTTLRAIMGLLKSDSGSVSLNGQNILDRPAHDRARLGIGYAPEDRRLIPDFDVEQNITLPALALGLSKAELSARLEEIYQLLPQLRTMRSRSGGSVSGGQGKIVALGRALMIARSVLLLDEPFQGLAPALALEYAQTLGNLRKQRPELALLVTESTPSLLERIADFTFQIERGEIFKEKVH